MTRKQPHEYERPGIVEPVLFEFMDAIRNEIHQDHQPDQGHKAGKCTRSQGRRTKKTRVLGLAQMTATPDSTGCQVLPNQRMPPAVTTPSSFGLPKLPLRRLLRFRVRECRRALRSIWKRNQRHATGVMAIAPTILTITVPSCRPMHRNLRHA